MVKLSSRIYLRFRNKLGFTLVEAIFAIVLLLLVFAVASAFFILTSRSTTYMENRNRATYSAEQGMEKLVDELRGNSGLLLMEENAVSFLLEGAPVIYTFDEGARLLRRNAQPFVAGVESFHLTYQDASGAETNNPLDVRRVVIDIVALSRGERLPLTSTVVFRTR